MSKKLEVRPAVTAALVKGVRGSRLALIDAYAAASHEADRLAKAGRSKTDAWSDIAAAARTAMGGAEIGEVSSSSLRLYGPACAFLAPAVKADAVGLIPSGKVAQLLYPCRDGASVDVLADVAKAHAVTFDRQAWGIADRGRIALAAWRAGVSDKVGEVDAAKAVATILSVDVKAAAAAKAEAEAAAAGATEEAAKAAGAVAAAQAEAPTTAADAVKAKRTASAVSAAIGQPSKPTTAVDAVAALNALVPIFREVGPTMGDDLRGSAAAALAALREVILPHVAAAKATAAVTSSTGRARKAKATAA